jgi:dipeptidase D
LHAKDTTLGADNGIAVAMMLAILADKTIEHGPLEMLFTADEEVGMEGVKGFDINKLKCKYVINLDSESDAEVCIGCPGNTNVAGAVPFKRDSAERPGTDNLKITIAGGLGGHSGLQIYQKRINAIKEIFSLVYILSEKHDLRIVEVCKSGIAFNVIPYEASIVINLKKDNIDLSKYLQDLKTAYPLEKNLTLTSE